MWVFSCCDSLIITKKSDSRLHAGGERANKYSEQISSSSSSLINCDK